MRRLLPLLAWAVACQKHAAAPPIAEAPPAATVETPAPAPSAARRGG